MSTASHPTITHRYWTHRHTLALQVTVILAAVTALHILAFELCDVLAPERRPWP